MEKNIGMGMGHRARWFADYILFLFNGFHPDIMIILFQFLPSPAIIFLFFVVDKPLCSLNPVLNNIVAIAIPI